MKVTYPSKFVRGVEQSNARPSQTRHFVQTAQSMIIQTVPRMRSKHVTFARGRNAVHALLRYSVVIAVISIYVMENVATSLSVQVTVRKVGKCQIVQTVQRMTPMHVPNSVGNAMRRTAIYASQK